MIDSEIKEDFILLKMQRLWIKHDFSGNVHLSSDCFDNEQFMLLVKSYIEAVDCHNRNLEINNLRNRIEKLKENKKSLLKTIKEQNEKLGIKYNDDAIANAGNLGS